MERTAKEMVVANGVETVGLAPPQAVDTTIPNKIQILTNPIDFLGRRIIFSS